MKKLLLILAFLPVFLFKPAPAQANCVGQGTQYAECTALIGQVAGNPDSVQDLGQTPGVVNANCRVSWSSPAYSLIQNPPPGQSCSIFWTEDLGKFSMWTPSTGTSFYFAPINLPLGE